MIVTPHLSHLPFDIFLYSGAGYLLGRLALVNEHLSAIVLATASIANHIIFQVTNQWIRPFITQKFQLKKDLSSESIYVGTHAVVSILTIIAAQQLNLLSRRVAGLFIFCSLGILGARISLLSK